MLILDVQIFEPLLRFNGLRIGWEIHASRGSIRIVVFLRHRHKFYYHNANIVEPLRQLHQKQCHAWNRGISSNAESRAVLIPRLQYYVQMC
jgi:hypothetical protein